MKTNFKKALIPFGVIVLGVVGAFASNAAKQLEKSDEAAMFGYHYDATQPPGQECQLEWVDCNPDSGDICTISGVTYYRSPIKDGLQCSFTLFKN
ncbi:DUF6520 family protein [Flavobacterium sp. I3-2]|uniref:DUF6520 family protein n=1 Tax=Flavobacterium sp. I3-2 TaxID=2748319 RepID=UPI002107A470|nr:DUF6520 family protein [Flavobacterium sp. I3-2]